MRKLSVEEAKDESADLKIVNWRLISNSLSAILGLFLKACLNLTA